MIEKEINNYKRLWQAVLIRLITDLKPDIDNKTSKRKRQIAIRLKLDALKYLKYEPNELVQVCEFAGLNFDKVLNKLKSL